MKTILITAIVSGMAFFHIGAYHATWARGDDLAKDEIQVLEDRINELEADLSSSDTEITYLESKLADSYAKPEGRAEQ